MVFLIARGILRRVWPVLRALREMGAGVFEKFIAATKTQRLRIAATLRHSSTA